MPIQGAAIDMNQSAFGAVSLQINVMEAKRVREGEKKGGCLAAPTPADRPTRPHILQEFLTVEILKGSQGAFQREPPDIRR